MPVAAAELIEITGIVIELHPKSGDKWSRAKVRFEDGRTGWVVAKFGLKINEVLTAKCTFNAKFKSYDVQNLVDSGEGKVSNNVVILKLVERLNGVGKVKARQLGEQFPELYETLISDPNTIAVACGADVVDCVTVANELKEERGNLSRVTALTDLGYPNHLAKQIALVDATYRIALESPYAAIRLVTGLGWALADEVGRKMGVALEDVKRIQAGIDHYYFSKVANDGHTRVSGEELLFPESLPSLLGIRQNLIQQHLDTSLVPLGNGWYTSDFHRRNAETIAGFFLGQ